MRFVPRAALASLQTRQLWLLALVLVACDKTSFPPAPQVRRTAQSVDGIAFGAVGQSLMGTDYLGWTSFDYFTYRDETRSLWGDGSVTVRKGVRQSRYEVEERQVAGAVPQTSHLTVRDRSNGEVMAERDIVKSRTWDHGRWRVGGWEGDEARKWLMTVLQPSTVNRPSYLQRDYAARTQVETAPRQIPLPFDAYGLVAGNQNAGCPEGQGAIRREPPVPVLQGNGWWYKPELPLQRVLCAGNRYLALSHVHGNQAAVDLLDEQGSVIFRTHLHVPVPLDSEVVALRDLKLSPTTLEFDMAYAVAEDDPHPRRLVPGRTYHVMVALRDDPGSRMTSLKATERSLPP
jgi:hypothetical protein